jgi:hypothetical protein
LITNELNERIIMGQYTTYQWCRTV